MAKLTIRNLIKSYGKSKILHGIELDIEQGELVSLLGPSGSGKTTILRCIAGLEAPDATSGEMRVGETVLSGPGQFVQPERRNLGMVFQNYAVWPHMTVADNVAFPLRMRSGDRRPAPAELAAQVSGALALVRLEKLGDRYPHQLSGGQQQRVALARALVMEPGLLLLDEPLSNLDALLREELGAEIRRLQKRLGLTTILVTHDQKEALSLSDRIVLLDQGRIAAQGVPEDLYSRPPSDFAAEFLSGAQSLTLASGERRLFLPRRWRLTDGTPDFVLASRIYLGNEYEYWAENPGFSDPIRFFASERREIGTRVALEYRAT
jgi:ABC-type Fe3+/spermidine/putrescine transport system ATPase subunit